MIDTIEFNKAFTVVVAKMVEEHGIKHSEFGRGVFGEHSGSRIWRICRQDDRGRAITVAEAARMAAIFNEDFPSFIFKIYQTMKATEQEIGK